MRNDSYWFGMRRVEDTLKIPPSGDAVIREPKDGWSRAFHEAVVQHYFSVRG